MQCFPSKGKGIFICLALGRQSVKRVTICGFLDILNLSSKQIQRNCKDTL